MPIILGMSFPHGTFSGFPPWLDHTFPRISSNSTVWPPWVPVEILYFQDYLIVTCSGPWTPAEQGLCLSIPVCVAFTLPETQHVLQKGLLSEQTDKMVVSYWIVSASKSPWFLLGLTFLFPVQGRARNEGGAGGEAGVVRTWGQYLWTMVARAWILLDIGACGRILSKGVTGSDLCFTKSAVDKGEPGWKKIVCISSIACTESQWHMALLVVRIPVFVALVNALTFHKRAMMCGFEYLTLKLQRELLN